MTRNFADKNVKTWNVGIDDDITRRDSLHATINSLPDPNYATLRALTLVIFFYIQVISIDSTKSPAAPTSGSRTLRGQSDECWESSDLLRVIRGLYHSFTIADFIP